MELESDQTSYGMTQVQRGFEAILDVLNLIPSSLDVSLISTALLTL
jgi:hypothetical protein